MLRLNEYICLHCIYLRQHRAFDKVLFNINARMHEAHKSKHVRLLNWHWIPMAMIAPVVG